MKKALGAFLISIPFALLFGVVTLEAGLLSAIIFFALSATVGSLLIVGLALYLGEL